MCTDPHDREEIQAGPCKYFQNLAESGVQRLQLILKTHENGLPQVRIRTYIVAVLKSAERKKFYFPKPLPSCVDLQKILRGQTVGPKDMLPSLAEPRPRALVINEFTKFAAKGAKPKSRIVVDIGASQKFSQLRSDGFFPSITAQRASCQDWWIADLGRRITVEELMVLQGFNPQKLQYKAAGVSVQRIGHMVGNAMSLNVLERLLPCVLACVGLHPTRACPDRWAQLVAGRSGVS